MVQRRDPRLTTKIKLLLNRIIYIPRNPAEPVIDDEEGGNVIHPRSPAAITLAVLSGVCLLYTVATAPYILAFYWDKGACTSSNLDASDMFVRRWSDGVKDTECDLQVDTVFMLEIAMVMSLTLRRECVQLI